MKNGLVFDERGNKYWYSGGKLHREDGPAVEWLNGDKYWYRDNKLHREDGPAVEWKDGSTVWCLDGARLGTNDKGFWTMWERLTAEQRANPNLLKHLPR